MVAPARRKVDGIADDMPDLEVEGDPTGGEAAVIGWGSTYGAIDARRCAGRATRARGGRRPTCATSIRSRRTSARCCARYDTVLVPEMNLGQLALLLRAEYLGRRAVAQQGAGQARSRAAEISRTSSGGASTMTGRVASSMMPTTAEQAATKKDFQRPGGPLVPGLRRLRDPRRRAEAACPSSGMPAREDRVRLRHRLLQPLPVLHEHLRLPHHPRARARVRHRAEGAAPGPEGLGRHRRRRRAVDRRQPPHPRRCAATST